jgi:hypothetical protein
MKSFWVKSLSMAAVFTGLIISPLSAENLAMFNGAILRDGKMLVMKNGETTPMEKEMVMSNGAVVSTEGKVKVKGAKTVTLKEGQIVQMDGTVRMTKPGMVRDHVMIKDGKSVVVKDGKFMLLEEEMTMPNGVVVMPNGSYTTKEGKTLKLKEGEKMTMDGKLVGMPVSK